jgi:hypothetical protein
MKKILFALSGVIFLVSCNRLSPREKDLQDSLNKPLHVELFETVQQGNIVMPFEEFRLQHNHISVVYLQNSCRPCYPKFIEWQNKMDSIYTPIDYTVLFVIGGGNRYDEFMSQVLDLEYVEDKFYTIMDPEFQFLAANKDIPRWIIDASVLIDSENKIKMVGAPWINEDITKLFY